MTCDVCLKDDLKRLSKRNDDPQKLWYCEKCAEASNKRIWTLHRAENLKSSQTVVKVNK